MARCDNCHGEYDWSDLKFESFRCLGGRCVNVCPECLRQLRQDERRFLENEKREKAEAERERKREEAEAERERKREEAEAEERELRRRAAMTPEERAAEDARKVRGKILAFVAICAFLLYSHFNGDDETKKSTEQTSKTTNSSIKISYLSGVSDISSLDELDDFFYRIASGFYNGEMGVKGDKEKVAAGNKMMENVYSFLGSSVRSVDSKKLRKLESQIKNDTIVSEYRKKRALAELDSGLKIIARFK